MAVKRMRKSERESEFVCLCEIEKERSREREREKVSKEFDIKSLWMNVCVRERMLQ